MSNEINGSGAPPPVVPKESTGSASSINQQNPNVGRPSPPASGGADTLNLTGAASQLQQLESTIAEMPVVDTQRVREVQQSLASGSMQVDPAKVAAKMLQFESDL